MTHWAHETSVLALCVTGWIYISRKGVLHLPQNSTKFGREKTCCQSEQKNCNHMLPLENYLFILAD